MNSTLYTAGVNTLLGDPKKAIIKLAIPIVTAQIAYATYIDLTVAYARILFLAFFAMLFNGSAMAILRSEVMLLNLNPLFLKILC